MNYGLIGGKLSHSYSKVIHQFLGNTSYELMERSPWELDEFINAGKFRGINVTIPYKQDVMPYCALSETAHRIGSVNTIVNWEGKLYGHNTDYDGFLYMAKKASVDFRDKKVLILGSGGTSKTALCVANDSGAKEIIIVSRNSENNYQNIEKHHDSRIIINTTPVGMHPENDGRPIEVSAFKRLTNVIDVIYNPLKTRLLLDAQKVGINFINGLSMLVAQAWFSHKLFFDIICEPAEDAEIIEKVLKKTEKHFQNIVLIGMPGCGKTTIGRELALRLKLKFIDTDAEIEKRIGISASDIIKEGGERFFRKIESDVISKTAKETQQVIATGGGSVMSQLNRDTIIQNGIILFLDRDISELSSANRPLSKDFNSLSQLYAERHPIYSALCDKKIIVSSALEDNISKILERIK